MRVLLPFMVLINFLVYFLPLLLHLLPQTKYPSASLSFVQLNVIVALVCFTDFAFNVPKSDVTFFGFSVGFGVTVTSGVAVSFGASVPFGAVGSTEGFAASSGVIFTVMTLVADLFSFCEVTMFYIALYLMINLPWDDTDHITSLHQILAHLIQPVSNLRTSKF